jgi:methyltransferase-like protein
MQDFELPAKAQEVLQRTAASPLLREQYLDFLRCREFRQTLLCHSEAAIDRQISGERVRHFFLSVPFASASLSPEDYSQAIDEFIAAKGASLAADWKTIKIALIELHRVFPQTRRYDELLEHTRQLARVSPGAKSPSKILDKEEFAKILLDLYSAALLQFHACRFPCVVEMRERPEISRLARLQLKAGNRVTTQLHTDLIITNAFDQAWLQWLDGTRNREELLARVADLLKQGGVTFQHHDQPMTDYREAMKVIEAELEANLAKIARLGLLVG